MRFTVGSVFGTFFSTIGGAFGPLVAVTAILRFGVSLVIYLPGLVLAGTPAAGVWAVMMIPLVIVDFLSWIAHWCAVIDIFLRKAANRPIPIGDVLRVSVINMFPVLLIMVMWLFCLFLGYTLLIVPGTLFAVVFQVTVPAYIGDKPGIFGAFSRSRDLTRGNRWGVFGLMVLINISLFVLTWVVFLAGGLAALAASYSASSEAMSPAAMAIFFLFGFVGLPALFVILPGLNASIYIVLRADKGDPLSGVAIEKVFE